MQARFIVILSNFAGELDRRYAHSESDAARYAIDMVKEAGELHEGDTIKIVRAV